MSHSCCRNKKWPIVVEAILTYILVFVAIPLAILQKRTKKWRNVRVEFKTGSEGRDNDLPEVGMFEIAHCCLHAEAGQVQEWEQEQAGWLV